MPQVAFQLSCPPDPFDVQHAGGTTVAVSAAADITVRWADGSADTIPAATQAATPAGAAAVDAAADLYLLVATKGGTSLTLIRLADALASGLDAPLGGAGWGIVAELTHERVREHQQGADSSVAVSPADGAAQEGDILYFHSGAWHLRHIGALHTVLASDGADPYYAKLSDLAGDMFPGHEGDILYYHLGAWISLPIGAPGQALTVIAGDPAWTDLGLGGGLGAKFASVSDLTLRVLQIPVGSTPPAGWQTVGFDDSGWTPAVAALVAPFQAGKVPQGANAMWNSADPGLSASPMTLLARETFTLPAGTPTDVSLDVTLSSNGPDGGQVWLNGVEYAAHSAPAYPTSNTDVYPRIQVPPPAMRPGATNVVAIKAGDGAEITQSYRWVAYTLGVDYSPMVVTTPTGTAEGSMLIFHAGKWTAVPGGTANGQKLTWVVGGIPTWS